MPPYTPWTSADAATAIAVPGERDDKYSRGVLGVVTGSDQYPGAAVLGVEAALHTGVGMLRYLGPSVATAMVLARRPEAVASPGRVQAWLLGSGMDFASRGDDAERLLGIAMSQRVPVVLDGGAIDLLHDATGPVVITPHYRELARELRCDVADVEGDPAEAANRAAGELGVTVLLKGSTTWVAGADGTRLSCTGAPAWLATAGAGDALGGILGALVATNAAAVAADPSMLARLAASASVIHGLAATRASGGGPFTILELTAQLPAVIADLVDR